MIRVILPITDIEVIAEGRSIRERTWDWKGQNEGETMAVEFVVCLQKENPGDISADDLQLGRLYEVVEKDGGHGMIRIIDESGEDYLYPRSWFDRVEMSAAASEQLAKALPHG